MSRQTEALVRLVTVNQVTNCSWDCLITVTPLNSFDGWGRPGHGEKDTVRNSSYDDGGDG